MKSGIFFAVGGEDGPSGDAQRFENELQLVDMVESLGFDSIWTLEHHFTDYALIPNPLQFLAYCAGRTKLALGSAVVVLPWHTPVRAASEIAMLDQICGGRFTLGLGRGLSRLEFEGFNIPLEERHGRFEEALALLLPALESGIAKFEGTYYTQPERQIRPVPTRTFKGRTYLASTSPDSLKIAAEWGLGIIVVAQKPYAEIRAELDGYREQFLDANEGAEPPPLLVSNQVFCDRDADRAAELGRQYMVENYRMVFRHYELDGNTYDGIKGFEHYSQGAAATRSAGLENVINTTVDQQVSGTPDECLNKIAAIKAELGASYFIGQFYFGGIDFADAKSSLQLFGHEVNPRIHQLDA